MLGDTSPPAAAVVIVVVAVRPAKLTLLHDVREPSTFSSNVKCKHAEVNCWLLLTLLETQILKKTITPAVFIRRRHGSFRLKLFQRLRSADVRPWMWLAVKHLTKHQPNILQFTVALLRIKDTHRFKYNLMFILYKEGQCIRRHYTS